MPHNISTPKVFCVLCRCQNAGNLGAAARAIKNMGLNGLILVRPNQELWLEGMKMAHGALDVLEEAKVYTSLREAISDMHLLIGTTRRIRKYRYITYTPRELFPEILNLASKNNVGILFGSEKTGLTNHELSFCQKVVTIPASPRFPSINLAQAVMIIAYEWHMACLMKNRHNLLKGNLPEIVPSDKCGIEARSKESLPRSEQRQLFIEHTERVLKRIGFIKKEAENIRLTLIDMFSRFNPTEREIAIMRGILTSIEYFLDKKENGGSADGA